MADITTFKNLQDYLNNASLSELKSASDFTELDAELLNQIASMSETFQEAPGLWERTDTVTIKELYEYAKLGQRDGTIEIQESDLELLEFLSHNSRYQNLRVGGFQKINNFEETENPSSDLIYTICDAVTVYLDDGTAVPCFAGTGMYWYSWIEDGALKTGLMESDLEAANYVKNLLEKNPKMNVIISGYSKGGNLAAYAGTAFEELYGERILRIYNMDGPSFYAVKDLMPEFYEKYVELLKSGKLLTYSPSDSMVAALMMDPDLSQYVRYIESSYWLFFLNHDYHNWTFSVDEAGNPHFVSSERSKTSQVFSKLLWNAIQGVNEKQWMEFLSVLTQICIDTGMDRTDQLAGKLQELSTENNLSDIIRVITSYLKENLSEQQFESLECVLKALTDPELLVDFVHTMLLEHTDSTMDPDPLRDNAENWQKLEAAMRVIFTSIKDSDLQDGLLVADAIADWMEREDIQSMQEFGKWLEQFKKQSLGKKIVTLTDLFNGMDNEQIAALKRLIDNFAGNPENLKILFSNYMSGQQAEILSKIAPLLSEIIKQLDFQDVIIIASAIGRYLELINCQSVSDCKQLFTMENGKISYLSVLNELFGLWATMSTSDRKTMACILHSLITTENLAALVKLLVADESGEISLEKARAIEIGISKNQGLQRAFDYLLEWLTTVLDVCAFIKSGWDQIQSWFEKLTSGKLLSNNCAEVVFQNIWETILKGAQNCVKSVISASNLSFSIPVWFADKLLETHQKKVEVVKTVYPAFMTRMEDITFSVCDQARSNICRSAASGTVFYDVMRMEQLKANIAQWENSVRSTQNSLGYLQYLIQNIRQQETQNYNLNRIQKVVSLAKNAELELGAVNLRLTDTIQKIRQMEVQLDLIIRV